jgi:hypothetical protein
MPDTSNVLTVKEIAAILRCSKAHVANVLNGIVPGLPRLTHLNVGRRRLVRKEWLVDWMDAKQDPIMSNWPACEIFQ